MKIPLLLVLVCLAGTAKAQAPAPSNPQNSPVPISVPPAVQAQVDSAWKDIRIAQLQLTLAIKDALEGMDKGVYYDFNQQKFFRPPTPPASAAKGVMKPALPAQK